MIVMAEHLVSQFLSEAISFLRNPVVDLRLSPSSDIARLEAELSAAQQEINQLRERNKMLEQKYGQEVCVSLHLQDICRLHGISYR